MAKLILFSSSSSPPPSPPPLLLLFVGFLFSVVPSLSSINNNLLANAQSLDGVPCPVRAASDRVKAGQVQVYFHNPTSKNDFEIEYDGEDWSQSRATLLPRQGFNASKPIVIYLHAYTQSSSAGWLEEVRRHYDEDDKYRGQFNLMFFDWSYFARQRYDNSASWAPRVGQTLAKFLIQLQKTSSSSSNDENGKMFERTHLVAYSLSTHIAGYAGRTLQASPASNGYVIGRITALDPTGVCFHLKNSPFASQYALRPSDARLVVARHFDMYTLGSSRPTGGVDVYVNGGKNQPTPTTAGFGLISGVWPLARAAGFRAASHHMASRNEVQEQVGDCRNVAYSCSSYAAYLVGECADCGRNNAKCMDLSTMDATKAMAGGQQFGTRYKPGTSMFIKTTQDSGCIYHYQAVLRLKSRPSSAQKKLLEESLSFVFAPGDQSQRNQKAKVNHESSSSSESLTYTALLTTANGQLADTNKIQMHLSPNGNQDKELEDQLSQLSNIVDLLQLNYMSSDQAQVRTKKSAKFCVASKNRGILRKC